MIPKFLKNNWLFILVLFFAFIFRIALLPFGNYPDIFSLADWGERFFQVGARNFYNNSVWSLAPPNQPPLFIWIVALSSYVYFLLRDTALAINSFICVKLGIPLPKIWFDNISWFTSNYGDLPFRVGHLILLKIPAVFADLGLGALIYFIAKKYSNLKIATLSALIYLFSPFSWYLSALWGQWESIMTLFVLGSFYAIYKKKFFLSSFLFFLAVYTKLTLIILLPLFMVVFLLQKPKFLTVILSFLIVTFTFFLLTAPLADENTFIFGYHLFNNKLFFKPDIRLTNQAFNVWALIFGLGQKSGTIEVLGIQANHLGLAVFSLFYLFAVRLYFKTRSLKILFYSVCIIIFSAWLFLTNMHERYVFGAFPFLIVILALQKKLLLPVILAVLMFSLNLYSAWRFPNFFLNSIFEFPNWISERIFSMVNLIVFYLIIKNVLDMRIKIFPKFVSKIV